MAHQDNQNHPTDEDRKADLKGIFVIFTALVLAALHFISGWQFDL